MNVILAQKQKSLQERWSEVTKRVELWVELMELNDNGEYVNVDVIQMPATAHDKRNSLANNVATGGIYQIRQVILLDYSILFNKKISVKKFIEFFINLGSTASFKNSTT